MDIGWDEDKRQAVIEKHGVDFLDAVLIFEGPVLTREDTRANYGEDRFISAGLVDGECFVVVHTQRENILRIITAWKGGKRERRKLEESVLGRHPPDEGAG